MSRATDAQAWASLDHSNYGFEDYLPIKLIVNAINERAACVGEEMLLYPPSIVDWCSRDGYKKIADRIADLVPKFAILDYDIYGGAGISSDIYAREQYSNFPLGVPESALRAGYHNLYAYPTPMLGENQTIDLSGTTNKQKLNQFYATCKYWLDRMYLVNIDHDSCVSSTIEGSFECDVEHQANAEGTLCVWCYVNGERQNTHDSDWKSNYDNLMVFNKKNILSTSKKVPDIDWYANIDLVEDEKELMHYWSDGSYHMREWQDHHVAIDFRNYPNICRFFNPATVDGDLVLMAKPARRVEYNNYWQEELTFEESPSPVPGYPYVVVSSEKYIESQNYSFGNLSTDIYQSNFKPYEETFWTGHHIEEQSPRERIQYKYDLDGNLLTSTTITSPYSDGTLVNYYNPSYFYIYDSCFQSGAIFEYFGEIPHFQVKQVELNNRNDLMPTSFNAVDILNEECTNQYAYHDFARIRTVDMMVRQRLHAYIDYRRGFTFKDISLGKAIAS